jgi:antitoxin component YwqK of YwqJK toxin-antitoxin module
MHLKKYLFLIIISIFTTKVFPQDTINQKDANGLKQGYWIVYYPDSKIKKEEGKYVNNKKEGVWKFYYPSGTIKQEVTYKDNKPDGYVKIYYENGKVSEEGIWKGNKWVGKYKFYHKNGNLAYDWNYNEKGKREGVQKYFYENGNIMIEGNWKNGKEDGVIKEYDENGNLKVEKVFHNGTLDVNSVKVYTQQSTKENQAKQENQNVVIKQQPKKKQKELEYFRDSGFKRLYNTKGQITAEGTFDKGKLIDGKKYFYDNDGNLLKINIYKNGRLVDIKYQ